ncbi:MAG TPA: hypothetical protein VEJ84_01865 [Acidimicrobiales bacterium]|nr:hypothetical protein [Acidimicrobiales bacterium]
MSVVAVRYSEGFDRYERFGGRDVWPEYNLHGDVLNRYWSRLYDVFPEYQFVLYDQEAGEVLAEGHTIPVVWDGTTDSLGPGIDVSIQGGFELQATKGTPSALCALAAEIPTRNRDRRLAVVILEQMAEVARSAELRWLIAPARPNWKDRYPLTPIERYVTWRTVRGEPFDPWIRVHTRMGGKIEEPIPESLRITGTVAEWESWTGMAFPEPAEYVFPGGLATVSIDLQANTGSYWEPNVWIVHSIAGRVVA